MGLGMVLLDSIVGVLTCISEGCGTWPICGVGLFTFCWAVVGILTNTGLGEGTTVGCCGTPEPPLLMVLGNFGVTGIDGPIPGVISVVGDNTGLILTGFWDSNSCLRRFLRVITNVEIIIPIIIIIKIKIQKYSLFSQTFFIFSSFVFSSFNGFK